MRGKRYASQKTRHPKDKRAHPAARQIKSDPTGTPAKTGGNDYRRKTHSPFYSHLVSCLPWISFPLLLGLLLTKQRVLVRFWVRVRVWVREIREQQDNRPTRKARQNRKIQEAKREAQGHRRTTLSPFPCHFLSLLAWRYFPLSLGLLLKKGQVKIRLWVRVTFRVWVWVRVRVRVRVRVTLTVEERIRLSLSTISFYFRACCYFAPFLGVLLRLTF